jgi:hypothetical protein
LYPNPTRRHPRLVRAGGIGADGVTLLGRGVGQGFACRRAWWCESARREPLAPRPPATSLPTSRGCASAAPRHEDPPRQRRDLPRGLLPRPRRCRACPRAGSRGSTTGSAPSWPTRPTASTCSATTCCTSVPAQLPGGRRAARTSLRLRPPAPPAQQRFEDAEDGSRLSIIPASYRTTWPATPPDIARLGAGRWP